jgi:hypothetical protein
MLHRAVVAHDQPAAVIHPAKAALDFPALAITRPRFDRAPALRTAPLVPLKGRDGRLDTPVAQALTKVMAVVGFVRHQLLRACTRSAPFLRDTYGRQGGVRQSALVGLGTVYVQTNRQAMPIRHDHHFTALADLRVADPRSPFLAGTKLPSRKARVHSSLPWASSWLSSARHIRAVEFPHRRHNMRSIGTLSSPRFESTTPDKQVEHLGEQALCRSTHDQLGPKLAQDRKLKPASGSSNPNAYFQSIRPRTASAACRWDTGQQTGHQRQSCQVYRASACTGSHWDRPRGPLGRLVLAHLRSQSA